MKLGLSNPALIAVVAIVVMVAVAGSLAYWVTLPRAGGAGGGRQSTKTTQVASETETLPSSQAGPPVGATTTKVPPIPYSEFFTINFSATYPVSFCADIFSPPSGSPYSICEGEVGGQPYFDFQNQTSGSECVGTTATTFYVGAIAYSLQVSQAARVTFSITESGGACGEPSSVSFLEQQSFLLESQYEVNSEVVPILLPSGYTQFTVNETTNYDVNASWYISNSAPGPGYSTGTSFSFSGSYSGVATLQLQFSYQVPETLLVSIQAWAST